MQGNDLKIINKYRAATMGFAAIWIFLFHEQEHEWLKVFFSPEILSKSLYFFKRIGYCGVDIFLLLSGIGLVYAREKHSLSVFYFRRIERVFIPFFIVALIRMLVENWSLSTFLRKVFLYDFLFVQINSLLWFIPAILILYLIFPFYYNFFKKARRKTLFTLCAYGVWLVLSLLLKDTLRGDLYSVTNRIPIFLTGILLAWFLREKDIKLGKIMWLFVVIVFFSGLALAFLTNYRELYLLVPISNCCVPTFLLAISVTLLISKAFSIIDRSIGTYVVKVFSFFGTISLEIYCVQEWLDDIIRPMITGSYENWMSNFALINLAIAVAVFFAAVALHYASGWVTKIMFKSSTKKF